MKLDERLTAVVTGGASGIGRGIVRELARQNVRVISLDIDDEKNEETAREAAKLSKGGALAYHLDVGDPQEISEVFDRLMAKEHIDILVNNAGIFIQNSYLKGSYEEALAIFDRQMNINARGTYLCTKKVARAMAERGYGAIINIVTNHLKRALYRPSRSEQAYDASKWAQYELNESMNRELSEHGIRVAALCPASTRTGMLQKFFDDYGIELNQENVYKVTHFNALLEPEDVGRAAVNVLSWDESQPSGKAYLLIYPTDCDILKQGHQESLVI